MKLGQLTDIMMGLYFQENFCIIWRTVFQIQTHHLPTITKLWCFTLLKVRTGAIKIIKHHQLKIKNVYFCLFYQNPKKTWN